LTNLPVPSEDAEQSAVVANLRSKGILIFSVPNGVNSSRIKGGRLKATGLLSGIPDLVSLLPDNRVIWIEMKKRKGGSVSPTQKLIHKLLQFIGFEVIVGKGAQDAVNKFWELVDEKALTTEYKKEVIRTYHEIEKLSRNKSNRRGNTSRK
jgi:Holliday junction resolvase